jgi:hypothetical protein
MNNAVSDEKDSSGTSSALKVDFLKHRNKLKKIAKRELRRGSNEVKLKEELKIHCLKPFKRSNTSNILLKKSDDENSKYPVQAKHKSKKGASNHAHSMKPTSHKVIEIKKKFEKSDGESSSATDNKITANLVEKAKKKTEGYAQDPLKSALKKRKDENTIDMSEYHSKFYQNNSFSRPNTKFQEPQL